MSIFLGSTGTKIHEGTTDYQNYTSYNTNYTQDQSLDFAYNIDSASMYEFSVKLIAPLIDTYESEMMESEEVSVTCYTNPSQLSGNYKPTDFK